MTQYAMYVDQTRCNGCFACVVACKDWHDVPAGPANWISVKTIEKGRYPDPLVAFLPTACCHCRTPACVSACPVEAVTKRTEDGIVIVDQEACLGKTECGQCLAACSYEAPQFDAGEDARMQKCDLCVDRWADGKKPVCVMACPMQALDAGPLDELKEKRGGARETEGFTYDDTLAPSILFKPKRIFPNP